MGDFIKGPLKGQYSKDIESGIWLHRKIDLFTDQHQCVKQCQTLFTPELRRFSGIVIDIAFDHFLARHWAQYDCRKLTEFNTQVLHTLNSYSAVLPEAAQLFAERMSSRDILLQYQLPEVIPMVLNRTAQRLSRPTPLSDSGQQFLEHYDSLETQFFEFFPELESFAREQRALL